MTNLFTDRLNKKPGSGAHTHGPTADEIQRWEDDGGAIRPDPPPQSAYRHRHGDEAELAAA